jgi:hypothetical protein
MDQITSYSQFNAPPWLIEKLKGSEVPAALAAVDPQFNDIETAIFGVMVGVWLDTAVGVQLDVLGIHLGLAREGRADADYRTDLVLQASILAGAGRVESVISLIRLLFDTDIVEYTPMYPAHFRVWQGGILDISPEKIKPVVPAGVGFHLAYEFVLENDDLLELSGGDTMIVLS